MCIVMCYFMTVQLKIITLRDLGQAVFSSNSENSVAELKYIKVNSFHFSRGIQVKALP